MQVLHRAESRGYANFSWLQSFHTFSFGNYFQPERVHLGVLRILNDNMEIISIPISGKIAHKDSTGSDGMINTGEVQIMSAGTGIRHSEFKASSKKSLQFLQIWVLPEKRNITLRYDQKFRSITHGSSNELIYE
jgi:redox-sensitive bicupin YhaK (pirin superfamily)